MSYAELWRRSVGNYLLGVLVSVVPAFAFYSLAFDYTPEQIGVLLRLAAPGLGVMLGVDLLVLRWTLNPLQRALVKGATAAETESGLERLLALPSRVLPRIFGVHAVTATLVFNLLVLWANRTTALGIPESHFPLYWLLNLTVVPVGHAVYEYHATE
ncbi:MAG: hypothetical protein ACRD4D_02445, partial [Candidatus Acidiferrales bacterium]